MVRGNALSTMGGNLAGVRLSQSGSGGMYANYNRRYPAMVAATGPGFTGESRVFNATGLGNRGCRSWNQYGSRLQSRNGKIARLGGDRYWLSPEAGRDDACLNRWWGERSPLWPSLLARQHRAGRQTRDVRVRLYFAAGNRRGGH